MLKIKDGQLLETLTPDDIKTLDDDKEGGDNDDVILKLYCHGLLMAKENLTKNTVLCLPCLRKYHRHVEIERDEYYYRTHMNEKHMYEVYKTINITCNFPCLPENRWISGLAQLHGFEPPLKLKSTNKINYY